MSLSRSQGKLYIVGIGPGGTEHLTKKAVELSREHIVSIISGGDANVYGMAGIVLEVAQKEGDIEIEVIPGVTAVSAAASLLGAPIVNDFAVISLSDLLTPMDVIEKRFKSDRYNQEIQV